MGNRWWACIWEASKTPVADHLCIASSCTPHRYWALVITVQRCFIGHIQVGMARASQHVHPDEHGCSGPAVATWCSTGLAHLPLSVGQPLIRTSPANNGRRKESRLTCRRSVNNPSNYYTLLAHTQTHILPAHSCRRDPAVSRASMAATGARCTISSCDQQQIACHPSAISTRAPSTSANYYAAAH